MTFELNHTEYEMNEDIEDWAKNQYEVYVGDTVKELKFNVEHENSARRGKLRSVSEDVTFPFKVIMPNGIEQFFALVYPIPVDETKVISEEALEEKGYIEPVNKNDVIFRPFKNMKEILDDCYSMQVKAIPPNARPLTWVRNKNTGDVYLITAYTSNGVLLDEFFDFEELFKFYEYLNGMPCGVRVI